MILQVKIAYKSMSTSRIESECFVEDIIDRYQISPLFMFLYALSDSPAVAQFTVSNNGFFYRPVDYGFGNMEKWVEKLTYVSDDEDVQRTADEWRIKNEKENFKNL